MLIMVDPCLLCNHSNVVTFYVQIGPAQNILIRMKFFKTKSLTFEENTRFLWRMLDYYMYFHTHLSFAIFHCELREHDYIAFDEY